MDNEADIKAAYNEAMREIETEQTSKVVSDLRSLTNFYERMAAKKREMNKDEWLDICTSDAAGALFPACAEIITTLYEKGTSACTLILVHEIESRRLMS